MLPEIWIDCVRKSIDAFQKAEDCIKNDDKIGAMKQKKIVALYDRRAEENIRKYFTDKYIAAGDEIGMSKEDVFKYIRLESQVVEIKARISKGEYHIERKNKPHLMDRMKREVSNLKFKLEAVIETMDFMVIEKEIAS